MENKEIRNLLLNNMKLLKISLVNSIKNELSDFTQIQKDLKKSRKLEFRPKDRTLQSIVDEIKDNRYKISLLLYYYRWIRHGLKYWANRDIKDFWSYQHSNISNNPNSGYPDTNRYQTTWWYNNNKTYEEYVEDQFYNYFIELINKYKIELTQEEKDNFIKYLYKNI